MLLATILIIVSAMQRIFACSTPSHGSIHVTPPMYLCDIQSGRPVRGPVPHVMAVVGNMDVIDGSDDIISVSRHAVKMHYPVSESHLCGAPTHRGVRVGHARPLNFSGWQGAGEELCLTCKRIVRYPCMIPHYRCNMNDRLNE